VIEFNEQTKTKTIEAIPTLLGEADLDITPEARTFCETLPAYVKKNQALASE
jgi:hypothetical protein